MPNPSPQLSRRRRLLLQAVLDSHGGAARHRRRRRTGAIPALVGWLLAVGVFLSLLGLCQEYFL
ncbi:MAG: hypothetical protein ACI4SG_06510 [Oligosphaeraceae bacterium]